MQEIPTFAIAGDPNVGKSTLVATLAEDDAVEIARRAGTTRVATNYTAEIDGLPVLNFVDLPGFENTAYLHHWLESHKNQPGNLAEHFLDSHRNDPEFLPECEILRSLKDAAVIYVVDASRPVERKDRDQAEILRLCTDKRIAVINVRSDQPQTEKGSELLAEWQELLGRHFTYREFNPHRATLKDRIELLEAISHVMPGWRESMKNVISQFKAEWEEGRLPDSCDAVMQLLEHTISIHETARLGNNRRSAEEVVRQKVTKSVRKLEEYYRKEIRRLFRHQRTDWQLPEGDLLTEDIFSEKVWLFFGLTEKQLIWAGAAAGTVIGLGFDLMTGGLSGFLATFIGAAAGAVGAWMAAGKSIEFRVPGAFFTKFTSTSHVEAQILPQSNLIWILLDRALLYAEAAANWSHGRREESQPLEQGKAGITSRWTNDERKVLIQWTGALRSGKFSRQKMENYEFAAREFLLEEIRKLATG